jgi:YVTN family beta-propeller protein
VWKIAAGLALAVIMAWISWPLGDTSAAQASRFIGPTSSQPVALNAEGSLLAVANPDNDSVTLFDVGNDENRRLAEVRVGDEPNGVTVLPDGTRAYAANTVSGTISVINTANRQVIANIAVGTEPYGLALTPNGRKLYVTNARANSVSVINTANNQVIATITNVGFEPRGIAITNDGDADDNDETVYVTQFLSLPRVNKLDGEDDSKVAFVTVLSTATDSAVGNVILNPITDTGFKAAGDAINRVAPPANPQPADFIFTTGAYPNQLNNIGIKGNFAYVPNTGASPNGPVRFNVNTQSLLHVINRVTNGDAGRTINMHVAVRNQTNPSRLFITQPWAIAFKNRSDEGFVVSAASNIVVKIAVDPTTGAATVLNDPFDPSRVLQIRVGKNPRGIVINSTDTRAYVMNEVSRDVTVIDLTRVPEQVSATLRSASLPTPGSSEDIVLIGKELYHTSVGEFDPPGPGQPPIAGRMSSEGWGSCGSCHPFGLSDNVVWIFAAGPRRTVPQHTDFDQTDPQRLRQRALNWSAIFDEEEDFELNIRGVSGGLGLIVQADGITPDNPVAAFSPSNANRRQLRVRGVNAWEAIKAFERFGIRAPISPLSQNDPDVVAGRQLFIQARCAQCHGGPQWTSARITFTPPPSADLISSGQLINELRKVGTFDSTLRNEVRANAATPLGADGFAPASLLSVFAFPRTFLHNGAVDSLDRVLDNVEHRTAGTSGVDFLEDANDRRRLVRFLNSIDARTPVINP